MLNFSSPIDVANTLLGRFWDLTLPVDPIAIAGNLGIKVFHSKDLKGLAGFCDFAAKEILISPHVSWQHQRFSIARELGHFVLGHSTRKKHTSVDLKEASIALFARSLLMPAIAVQTLVEQQGKKFSESCAIFNVSEQLLAYRLTELGIV